MRHEFQTDDPARSFGNVWKRVITEPRAFFQEMPVTGGLLNPLIFLLICLAISALAFLVFGPRHMTLRFMIAGLARGFIGAAILMVIARQIFSGVGDYEATFRAVAYAAAPVALFWVPLIGPLAMLYAMFLLIIGLERVHGFDAVKSVLTVLLAVVAGAVLGWVLGSPWWWYAHPRFHGCA